MQNPSQRHVTELRPAESQPSAWIRQPEGEAGVKVFPGSTLGLNNPPAEKTTRFHPRASTGGDERYLDRPRKMKPPKAGGRSCLGNYGRFHFLVPAHLTGRPGYISATAAAQRVKLRIGLDS